MYLGHNDVMWPISLSIHLVQILTMYTHFITANTGWSDDWSEVKLGVVFSWLLYLTLEVKPGSLKIWLNFYPLKLARGLELVNDADNAMPAIRRCCFICLFALCWTTRCFNSESSLIWCSFKAQKFNWLLLVLKFGLCFVGLQ